MKGTTALAVAVCIVCFFIGYLTYLGAMFFIDFLIGRIDPCQNSIQQCSTRSAAGRELKS